MPPTLYLIDGHALAYRMYFALTAVGGSQRWQTSKGEPTAGIYGFARELLAKTDPGVWIVRKGQIQGAASAKPAGGSKAWMLRT